MVQGTSKYEPVLMNSSGRDMASRKASYEAVQKQAQQSRNSSSQGSSKSQTNQASNPWGPVFKSKSNFVDMHNC